MPQLDFIVRSREHTGSGSDTDIYGSGSAEGGEGYIPDHYVRRLWCKRMGSSGQVTFTNKDSTDRSPLYTYTPGQQTLAIIEGTAELARVERVDGRTSGKSRITLGAKSTTVKDVLRRSGPFSTTRLFTSPDGIEYKWKPMYAGNNPLYPEASFRMLFAKDSKHPVATTERLVARDGDPGDTAYPVYIAERGLAIQSWIVLTLVLLEVTQ